MEQKIEWGWTSYKKTGWMNKDGLKEYHCKFTGIYPATVNGREETTIVIYSKHPVKALSEIIRATEELGATPMNFHNAYVEGVK